MDQFDIKENSIPAEEEDKKFASQAVTFVIGHTRNGFVSLCASVATLLKEKANLKLENESLRQQIEELKQFSILEMCNSNEELMPISDERKFENNIIMEHEQSRDEMENFKFKRKGKFETYKAIKGCLCNNCTGRIFHPEESITPPLEKGNRVVICGEICGSVTYIGHIDEVDFPEIFVGLHLDEAVGNINGTIKNKTYFTVPHHYGYLAPLSSICCIMD